MNNVTLRPVTPLALLVEKLASMRSFVATANVDDELRKLIDDADALARGLEPYIEACSAPESADLRALADDTRREHWARRFQTGYTTAELEGEMLSGHIEGQFLKTLVHGMKATRLLEIGLFTGYSALAMAEALPEHGRLIACEVDAFAAGFAQRAFASSPHGRKIHIEMGDAAESMRRFAERGDAFDLIFIDADKGNYHVYLDLALEGALLAPGGLVCVDNTLMQGQPYLEGPQTDNGRAIAAFNRRVSDDPRIEAVMLPIRDGVTLIRRA